MFIERYDKVTDKLAMRNEIAQEVLDAINENGVIKSSDTFSFYTEFLCYVVKECNPYVCLYDVSYNDKWSNEQANEFIRGKKEPSEVYDWDPYYAVQYYFSDFFTKKEQEIINEMSLDFVQEIENAFFELDKSDPIKELNRNTDDLQYYYYTGKSVGTSEEELSDVLTELGIDLSLEENSEPFNELQGWNFYGGQIQIFFKLSLDKMIEAAYLDKHDVVFVDPCIGLADIWQGSGGYAEFKGEIRLPYDKLNAYVASEGPGYPLTEVFGDDDIGDCKSVSFVPSQDDKEIQVDNWGAQYDKWDALLKEGKCSFDDPRFTSHKTEYRNDYPCGHKCKNCGRFFID